MKIVSLKKEVKMDSFYPLTALALIVFSGVVLVQTIAVYRLLKTNRRLLQKVDELSTEAATDSLTGLLNRRSLDRAVSHVFTDRKRNPTEDRLTVFMGIDLDKFKSINDTYGHDVGDHALIHLAKSLRQVVRNEDIIARQGGDEFAVIATVRNMEALVALVAKLRRAVDSISISASEEEVRFTVSIGVAEFDAMKYAEPVDLLRAADLALYKTKEEGRNGCFLLDHRRGEFINLVY